MYFYLAHTAFGQLCVLQVNIWGKKIIIYGWLEKEFGDGPEDWGPVPLMSFLVYTHMAHDQLFDSPKGSLLIVFGHCSISKCVFCCQFGRSHISSSFQSLKYYCK